MYFNRDIKTDYASMSINKILRYQNDDKNMKTKVHVLLRFLANAKS